MECASSSHRSSSITSEMEILVSDLPQQRNERQLICWRRRLSSQEPASLENADFRSPASAAMPDGWPIFDLATRMRISAKLANSP